MARLIKFAFWTKRHLVRKYLENKLFCLDIKSAKVAKQPWIKDEYLRASEFCIDAVAGKLVVVDQSRAYAVDLKSGDVMAEFTLDHLVKSCEAKFIDSKLAVRTDYGCFSLYEISGRICFIHFYLSIFFM